MSKFSDLWDFHKVMGVHRQRHPYFPEDSEVELRKSLMREEMEEVMEAIDKRDLVAVADGLVDLVYVVVGTAVSFGIPFNDCWREVHATNMAKVDPATGKVKKREDGKVLKPEGWKPPDLETILDEAKKRVPRK